MHPSLKVILDIQELDIQMLRLMRLKRARMGEMDYIENLRTELKKQQADKETEISELNHSITAQEEKIAEIKERIKQLESKQNSVKKVDDFNALNQEMSASERARVTAEQTASDLIDKKNLEEEILEKIKESLILSEESSANLEAEIQSNVLMINKEGSELMVKRAALAKTASEEVIQVYTRLFENKKDRVVVPIENRTCSGCHIALTAQHENLVRKGEKLVFCEHCSRLHYWQDSGSLDGSTVATKRRRRKTATT